MRVDTYPSSRVSHSFQPFSGLFPVSKRSFCVVDDEVIEGMEEEEEDIPLIPGVNVHVKRFLSSGASGSCYLSVSSILTHLSSYLLERKKLTSGGPLVERVFKVQKRTMG